MTHSVIVRCACGEAYHARPEDTGRRIKCRCGRSLEVRHRGVRMSMLPRSTRTLLQHVRRWVGLDRADARVLRRIKIPQSAVERYPVLARVGGGLVRWSCRGYLAAVVLAWAALWLLSDRWWPATVLLFAGRWVLLLPLVLLVPAALLLERRLLLLLAAAAAIVVGPVMGLELPWKRLTSAGGRWDPRMRVVSFNAAGGDSVAPRLPDILSDWNADVVAVQECGDVLGRTMAALGRWQVHRERMLCLMSRYPIRSAEVMDRSALEITERSGVGGAGDVVRYVIETPAGPVRVVNVHLETVRKGFDALLDLDFDGMRDNLVLRDAESRLARRWAEGGDRSLPLVVLGDFNLPPQSRIFRAHWGDLRDAHGEVGAGYGFTRYNGWIRARIDYVLTNDRWRPADATVWTDLSSDHRPLVVELVRAK